MHAEQRRQALAVLRRVHEWLREFDAAIKAMSTS
jgi:hypothetical protein